MPSYFEMFILLLQRRNLRILYDAIGTLADAVGSELNNVSGVIPLHLWVMSLPSRLKNLLRL